MVGETPCLRAVRVLDFLVFGGSEGSTLKLQLLLFLLLFANRSALSQVVPDQQFAPPSAGWSQAHGRRDIAQTFSIGVEGILNHIDLHVNHQSNLAGNMFWDLRQLDGTGAPIESNDAVVVSGAVRVSDLPDYFDQTPYVLDLSAANISVEIGDRFALVVRTDIGNVYWLGHANSGVKYERTLNGRWQVDHFSPARGHSFSSFVRVVPEPTTFGPALLAVVALFGRRRKLMSQQ